MSPYYGQVVVGPPGSGKTTYCDGMQQYLRLLGRDAAVVNLDPANDRLPYETIFNVGDEVVNLTAVMEQTGLGPNGGLMYCMEYLDQHIDDLLAKIRAKLGHKTYLLFDLPGQVELYTHAITVQHLMHTIAQALDLRLTAVQLVDAHYCTDASKFLSAALLSTTTMLRLELPTVNVLSKVDLLAGYGELPMQLEYFTECHDLDRLVPFLDHSASAAQDDDHDIAEDTEYQQARQRRRHSTFSRKLERLHANLAEVVEDFGLLSFVPLDISSAESVGRVLARIDKANGHVFIQGSVNEDLFQCAVQTDVGYESLADVKERLSAKESLEELQR